MSDTLAQGMRCHRKGDFSAALRWYAQCVEQQPDCLDAWLNAGSAHSHLGQAAETVATLERASHLADGNARAWRDIGIGLATVGELDAACQALERSVLHGPSLVGSWLHLARLRLETAESPLPADAARQATLLAPGDASAHLLHARCLFEDADREPALAALVHARACATRSEEAAVLLYAFGTEEHDAGRSGGSGGAPRSDSVSTQARVRAATYLRTAMKAARLFASTRDTLRAAMSAAPPQGSVVELGVRHGVSLRWLAQSARSQGRVQPVHGFDSFFGLPTPWAQIPKGTFSTAGTAPTLEHAALWAGQFDERLPEFMAKHSEPLALLHVDSDLYESARTGLTLLAPLLRPGTIIAFDEYLGHRTWEQDEFRAFQGACREHGWRYEYLFANFFTGQAVVRLLSI